jgi:hypothetical protein
VHANPRLHDPRSRVQFLGDEVYGAAVLGVARLQDPAVGVEASKVRMKQASRMRMNPASATSRAPVDATTSARAAS